MEDVGYLEADSVDQDQVSANEHVAIARIGRRKHYLQLLWARLHCATKTGRQGAVHDQLTLEPWRQAITLGEPGRKLRAAICAAIGVSPPRFRPSEDAAVIAGFSSARPVFE